MKEYSIDILNVRCPICLDIFKDPYLLPSQANCISCYKYICDLFKWEPKPFCENEVQILAKCICNEENIKVDKTIPCHGVKKMCKNIIKKCKNSGCPFFINSEMEESLLETHVGICG